jgi:hypothetical protein
MTVRNFAIVGITALVLTASAPLAGSKSAKAVIATGKGTPVLWRDPGQDLDLFYGAGCQECKPQAPFTFIKEDLGGSSPKYTVRDRDGVKWKIKLGPEARAETAASRLVWAAGFFVREDYLIPELRVEGLPSHLKRHKLIEPGGVMRNARLTREPTGEEYVGEWKWRDNPFRDRREWNGLRVAMSLLNNWDVKDDNNAVYQKGAERIYMVSDLGASFGASGRSWPASRSKDNFNVFRQSHFVCGQHDGLVDFCSPRRASIAHLVDPIEYRRRLNLRWIGRDIPRSDAKWMGSILSRLSPRQIRDAFRAGGYSPAEIEGFSALIAQRISTLTDL